MSTEGIVTNLVLWYASFSIILLFFISPLKSKNKWVKQFRNILPIALIPLLSMMFLAIGIRINTYGVTESRYFVIILGLWNLGIAFYYIFSYKKNNIILPLTLAIVALIAVFGPWSSYSVSVYSQNNRFEKIINKYDMVKDNTIIKSKTNIAEEDQKEIQAILRYFKNNHQFDDLKYLPDDFKISETENLFGFSYYQNFSNDRLKHYSYYRTQNRQGILIKDYDIMFHMFEHINQVNNDKIGISVKIENETNQIVIIQNLREVYRKSIIEIIKELKHRNETILVENLKPDDYIFIDENNNFKVKYIFNSFDISFKDLDFEDVYVNKLDFYLLIKY